MNPMIHWLVDGGGTVYLKDGAESHAEVAAAFDLTAPASGKYRFDLVSRRVIRDQGDPATDRPAMAFAARTFGTPEHLMEFARQGHLPKLILAELLTAATKPQFLAACAAVEQHYTEACQAVGDPCLDDGCAMDEGEVCLQPLARAESAYNQACAAEWATFFAQPSNRIGSWR